MIDKAVSLCSYLTYGSHKQENKKVILVEMSSRGGGGKPAEARLSVSSIETLHLCGMI